MRIIEQIPCLAAEELNNNALVPFQIVPPMLSRCLHLYININIMASASHYHDDAIFLSLDDLILISFHSSAHLPPFCLSSSVLAPCWASAPWLTMLRFLSSMVPYNYLLFLPPQHVVYLFVSPCSHSNNLETNSCESCWSLPANSILNFPTWDLKSEGAIDLYWDDQSAFKT